MPTTLNSANMSLPIPVVGVAPGPEWASSVNSCLTIIDQHNHAPGYGVQITPDGLNISSDLRFLNNSAIDLGACVFTPVVSYAGLTSLYFISNDLYVNDGAGNVVRITQSGGVAGSPGSIANLTSPASASYVSVSATFVWQSAASVAANMDFGAAVFRNISPNSTYGVTVSAPATLGSNYSIVLPSLPASQKIMSLDASGNMAAPYSVDNSTIEISSNTIQVKDLGIVTAKLAASSVTTAKISDAAVTHVKLGALGQQSTSVGSFSTSSTTPVDVGLSVTITTSGRPVYIGLQPSTGSSFVSITRSATVATGLIIFVRDSTTFAQFAIASTIAGATSVSVSYPTSFIKIDAPAAGTYTYKVQTQANISGTTVAFTQVELIVFEQG